VYFETCLQKNQEIVKVGGICSFSTITPLMQLLQYGTVTFMSHLPASHTLGASGLPWVTSSIFFQICTQNCLRSEQFKPALIYMEYLGHNIYVYIKSI